MNFKICQVSHVTAMAFEHKKKPLFGNVKKKKNTKRKEELNVG